MGGLALKILTKPLNCIPIKAAHVQLHRRYEASLRFFLTVFPFLFFYRTFPDDNSGHMRFQFSHMCCCFGP